MGGGIGVSGSPAQGAGCAANDAAAAQGDAGAPSTGGQFGSGGYTPGDGLQGGTGGTGPAGAAGSAGRCRTGCGQCLDTVHCEFTSESATVCGAQGQGGCGGGGGLGGGGGGGGGSSIALYVWDALVTCVDTVFATGNGGSGAPGGAGGDGGAPTPGATGAASTCETGCSFECIDGGGCPVCIPSSQPAAGGPAGTAGQPGAMGGSGGSGAGGWSCGYYAGGSGSVTVLGASTFSVGEAGAGGSAAAASGVAATKCPP